MFRTTRKTPRAMALGASATALTTLTLAAPASPAWAAPSPTTSSSLLTITNTRCTNGYAKFAVRVINSSNTGMALVFSTPSVGAPTPKTATIPAHTDQTVPVTLPKGATQIFVTANGAPKGSATATMCPNAATSSPTPSSTTATTSSPTSAVVVPTPSSTATMSSTATPTPVISTTQPTTAMSTPPQMGRPSASGASASPSPSSAPVSPMDTSTTPVTPPDYSHDDSAGNNWGMLAGGIGLLLLGVGVAVATLRRS